jgi:hypothetical protein
MDAAVFSTWLLSLRYHPPTPPRPLLPEFLCFVGLEGFLFCQIRHTKGVRAKFVFLNGLRGGNKKEAPAVMR